jgi:hypothetical protein
MPVRRRSVLDAPLITVPDAHHGFRPHSTNRRAPGNLHVRPNTMKYATISIVVIILIINNAVWYICCSDLKEQHNRKMKALNEEFTEYKKHAPGPVGENDITFDLLRLEMDMRDAKSDEMRVLVAKRFLNETLNTRELLSESTLYAHNEMIKSGWMLWRIEKPSEDSVILRRKELAYIATDVSNYGGIKETLQSGKIVYIKIGENGIPAMVKGKLSNVNISVLDWKVLK